MGEVNQVDEHEYMRVDLEGLDLSKEKTIRL